jgi:flagellar protein FlgJ
MMAGVDALGAYFLQDSGYQSLPSLTGDGAGTGIGGAVGGAEFARALAAAAKSGAAGAANSGAKDAAKSGAKDAASSGAAAAANSGEKGAWAGGAEAGKKGPVIDRSSELYKQCEALETFLIKNLISGMRKTVMKSDLVDTGFAGQMYEDMLYDEYARDYAKNAGFGLADLAYLELTGQRGRLMA